MTRCPEDIAVTDHQDVQSWPKDFWTCNKKKQPQQPTYSELPWWQKCLEFKLGMIDTLNHNSVYFEGRIMMTSHELVGGHMTFFTWFYLLELGYRIIWTSHTHSVTHIQVLLDPSSLHFQYMCPSSQLISTLAQYNISSNIYESIKNLTSNL